MNVSSQEIVDFSSSTQTLLELIANAATAARMVAMCLSEEDGIEDLEVEFNTLLFRRDFQELGLDYALDGENEYARARLRRDIHKVDRFLDLFSDDKRVLNFIHLANAENLSPVEHRDKFFISGHAAVVGLARWMVDSWTQLVGSAQLRSHFGQLPDWRDATFVPPSWLSLIQIESLRALKCIMAGTKLDEIPTGTGELQPHWQDRDGLSVNECSREVCRSDCRKLIVEFTEGEFTVFLVYFKANTPEQLHENRRKYTEAKKQLRNSDHRAVTDAFNQAKHRANMKLEKLGFKLGAEVMTTTAST